MAVAAPPMRVPARPPRADRRRASARNCSADVAAAGAQGPAQADLGAAFEDGDDHDVGDADPADQQGDRAQAEEQPVVGAFGGHFGFEDVGGAARVDGGGVGRVDGGGQHVVHGVDLAGHGCAGRARWGGRRSRSTARRWGSR